MHVQVENAILYNKQTKMTKEQIEAEGFKEITPPVGNHLIPGILEFGKTDSRTGFTIKFVTSSNHLEVTRMEPSSGMSYKTVILYNGPCPSMEDFKYIIGLFKNY